MKKETIDMALYSVVELTEKYSGIRITGWLVPYKNRYRILPIDSREIYTFWASSIKFIRYLSNGYILR